MIEAVSLKSISKHIQSNHRNGKIVGILFCQPDSPLGKEEIVPSLNYFHHYSGKSIDFYCVGYGAYWPPGTPAEKVITIDCTEWLFSSREFSTMVKDLEMKTSWKYSGETELILLDTNLSAPDKLDFQSAIVCNLEEMRRDKAFSSVRSFFQNIFNNVEMSANVWGLSDQLGFKVGTNVLKDWILRSLPRPLSDLYRRGRRVAIRNIAK